MGILTHDADDIISKLEDWHPQTLRSEKEYEVALYEFLNREFPDHVFHQQYTNAKTRADIFVDFGEQGDKVAIELKADLQDRGELHRLMGQLFEYVHVWGSDAILVLCGKSDPASAKIAREFVAMLNNAHNEKVRILVVNPQKA